MKNDRILSGTWPNSVKRSSRSTKRIVSLRATVRVVSKVDEISRLPPVSAS